MTLNEKLTLGFSAVQTVVVVISLLGLWWQLRNIQQTYRQEGYARAIDDYNIIAQIPVENPNIAKHLYPPESAFSKLDGDLKPLYGYIALCIPLFERIFILWSRGALDKDIWRSWDRWFTGLWLTNATFQVFWREEAAYFTESFQQYVNQKMKKEPV